MKKVKTLKKQLLATEKFLILKNEEKKPSTSQNFILKLNTISF